MKILRTLIVEDDEVTYLYLQDLLKDHLDVIGEIIVASSYSEAVSILTCNNFNLSILDNKLGTHTSFELLKLFNREKFGMIVYTSKIDDPKLEDVMSMLPDIRFYKPYDENNTATFIAELKEKIEELTDKTITVSDKDISFKVPFNQVLFIEGAGNYSKFICRDSSGEKKEYLKLGSIGEFEFLTKSGIFCRLNRSHIINLDRIEGVKRKTEELVFDLNPKFPTVHYPASFISWINERDF